MVKSYIIIILLGFLNIHFAFSEDVIADEAVTYFNEKITFSLFGNYKIGIFTQGDTANYRSDIPWNIGLGVRYKKISAQISVPVSFNNIGFENTEFDMEIKSYFDKGYFDLFVKRYKNFSDDNDEEFMNAGLDIFTAGIKSVFAYNQNHSLVSVNKLDRKQNISNGSFIYGLGAFYTSIFSENNNVTHYKERERIVYSGPIAGYSYIWVLPHDLFINAVLTVGTNLGFNINAREVLYIPQLSPAFIFGHHNYSWSVNLGIDCNTTIIVRGENDNDILFFAPIAITFSKRF